MPKKSQSSYRLTLFGPPSLDGRGGRPIRLEDKRLALLLFLLLAPPRGFRRRDSILPIFWPELGQQAGRHALRQALYILRETLGPATIVTKGREELALHKNRITCDVLEFERRLQERDSVGAVNLYRGEFLEGFHVDGTSRAFEEWIDAERAALRKRVIWAFRDAAGQGEQTGNGTEALGLLRRAHAVDPTDENVVRELIQLLDRLGDRSGALELYQTFARLVRKEYASTPAPETRAVAAGVREASLTSPPRIRPPRPGTSIVGRETLMADLATVLSRNGAQWITLTGPAGVGKTRVAVEVAHRWVAEGADAVFASLAGVQEEEQVLTTIGHAFGVPVGEGTLHERLGEAIGDESVLLIVDNLEHLPRSAVSIAQLFDLARNLKILVTSRSPLHVEVEREIPVSVLSLPDPSHRSAPEFVARSAAVRLFAERAAAARPGFRLDEDNAGPVAEICRRLDGLPLAIELAAARIRVLSPRAISDRLERRFELLKGGPQDAPERSRSLAKTIGWSYDLLSDSERKALSWIALFPAGCDLDVLASYWVEQSGTDDQALDLATSLVEKSLVVAHDGGAEPRFKMLETIREFALGEAEKGSDMEQGIERYVAYWTDWAEKGTRHYCTDRQPEILHLLELEHENLRTALRRALSRRDVESAGRLGAALWWFWWTRGFLTEGRRWLQQVLAADRGVSDSVRAKVLQGAGNLARGQGDYLEGVRLLAESLNLQRGLDDAMALSMAVHNLGLVEKERGDFERAQTLFEEGLELCRQLGHSQGIAAALDGLGTVAEIRRDMSRARSLFEQSLAIGERSGDDHRTAHALLNLGSVAERERDLVGAQSFYERSLDHFRVIHATTGSADTLASLARLSSQAGAYERAREQLAEALGLYREAGSTRGVAATLVGFAALNLAMERADRSAQLCGGIEAMMSASGILLESPSLVEWEAVTGAARERLGAKIFRESWFQGRRMSLEETIVLALQLAPAGRRTRTVKGVRSG